MKTVYAVITIYPKAFNREYIWAVYDNYEEAYIQTYLLTNNGYSNEEGFKTIVKEERYSS